MTQRIYLSGPMTGMLMTQRIYLSGPMTGLPDLNFPAFNAYAAALRAKGLQVVNPTEINAQNPDNWASCMRADIKALCDCDAICLMPGWESSRGAHLELHIAHRLELAVLYVHDLVGPLQHPQA